MSHHTVPTPHYRQPSPHFVWQPSLHPFERELLYGYINIPVVLSEFFYSEFLAAGSLDQLSAPLECILADA